MKGHCDRHLGRFLEGSTARRDWIQCVCEVCNRILSSRFCGRYPSCWPAVIAGQPLQAARSSRYATFLHRSACDPLFPSGLGICWRSQCGSRGVHLPLGHMCLVDLFSLPSLVFPTQCVATAASLVVQPTRPDVDAKTAEPSPPGTLGSAQ